MFCNKNHKLLLSKAATLVSSVDSLVSSDDILFASVDRLFASVDSLFDISVKSFDVKYPLSFANWLTLVGIDVISILEFQLSLSSWVT